MSFNISALFNQKLLNMSMDNFAVNNLCLCSRMIESSENIYEISITKDFVIITAVCGLYYIADRSGCSSGCAALRGP